MLALPVITPYLFYADAAAAIEFYKAALGATLEGDTHMMPNTNKIMHARLNIAGGLIMVADDFSAMREDAGAKNAPGESPIMLALTVDDAQAFWDKAVAGGVIVQMPMAKMFWGQLYGQFNDPFGHRWSVSETVQEMSDAEMQAAAEKAMKDKGTLMGDPVEEEAAA